MRAFRTWLLYALCSPWDSAVIAVLSAPLFACGVERARRSRGVIFFDVRTGSLLCTRWRYSTTFGHVVLLQPGLADSAVEEHERIHVEQFEGAVCAGWLIAVVAALGWRWAGSWGLAPLLVLWPWWSYFGASCAAWLRGRRPYLDNHFERHARAETAFGEAASHVWKQTPGSSENQEP